MSKQRRQDKRLEDVKASCPPITPSEALRRNTLYNWFGILEDRAGSLRAGFDKHMDKHEEGDTEATRIIMDLGKMELKALTGSRHSSGDDEHDDRQKIHDLRRNIVGLMSVLGPLSIADILAKIPGSLLTQVEAALNHPWFDAVNRTKSRWAITDEARGEVLGRDIVEESPITPPAPQKTLALDVAEKKPEPEKKVVANGTAHRNSRSRSKKS